MNAAEVAVALGKPRREGRHWRCLCPLHGGHSLIVGDGAGGQIIFKCWGGCGRGDLVAEFRRRNFLDGYGINYRFSAAEERSSQRVMAGGDQRIARATVIWNEAGDPRGTVAAEYLATRAVNLMPELCSRVLRFHPACPWRNSQTDKVEFVAAMIVLFRSINDDRITGIHRIRLDQPERWPKADRMMLGGIAGSAVKFDPVGNCLVIGEGVETCMAARELGLRPVWALGSAAGIENFPLFGGVERLVILGENDNGTNRNAALKCRQSWRERRVSVVNPRRAKDMNDVIMRIRKCQTPN